jgi:hypothetical protein
VLDFAGERGGARTHDTVIKRRVDAVFQHEKWEVFEGFQTLKALAVIGKW